MGKIGFHASKLSVEAEKNWKFFKKRINCKFYGKNNETLQ